MILLKAAVIAIVLIPLLLVVLLGLSAWTDHKINEYHTSRIVGIGFSSTALAVLIAAGLLLGVGRSEARVELGTWFMVGDYAMQPTLLFDRLSLLFALFGALLVGLVGAFSSRYMHREPGFSRFYFLLTLLGAGVEIVVLGGSIDVAFFGWELVGLSSALLVAFFHDRPGPVRNGLRAFITYRACDVGLLGAAVWLHHSVGSAATSSTLQLDWVGYSVPASVGDATIIGLLLLWAAIGKSAQVPLGGWLPRAMEGPTPSSAIFYGALSIHLGPYLLLRAAPILERSAIATIAVVLIGVTTAVHATFVGRVQTDIKSALAYASMTQVGLIFVEIGLGLYWLAVIHIFGHMAVRTLQILRAPSVLAEFHGIERSLGTMMPRSGGHFELLVPVRIQTWLYGHALERGYLDSLLRDYLVGGVSGFLRGFDRLEKRWIAVLSGPPRGRPEPRAQAEPSAQEGVQ
jgi:NADH:ubiquinone oxidoreductase subunit 5 (subunit L)/multisubunit Na+/H+ antiporter MnhA subunit